MNNIRWFLVCTFLCGCQDKGPRDLSAAIENGDLQSVVRLLDERPELLEEPYVVVRNQGNPGGVSSTNVSSSLMSRPLYQAVDLEAGDIVDELLSRGALIDGRGYGGQTPLMAAVRRASDDGVMMRRLLALGADAGAHSDSGGALIHFAAGQACCHTSPLEILLDMGTDLETAGENGWTALHVAANNGFVEGAALLCAAGANADALTSQGERAVDIARNEERPEIVRWFEHPDGCSSAARLAPLFADKELRNITIVAWGECVFGRARECVAAGVGLGARKNGALDRALAQRLFERGCTLDNALSCHNMGLAVEQGWAGPRDRQGSEVFYQKACKLGHEKSCNNAAEFTRENG